MYRPSWLLIALGCGWLLAASGASRAPETVVLEAAGLTGEGVTRGFDRGVWYIAPEKGTATGRWRVGGGRYEVYARVYFCWARSEHVTVEVGGQTLVAGTQVHRPFRWDLGNIQVWHWVRAGEVQLAAGEHEVKIKGPGRLAQVVAYQGATAWREDWLAGPVARLAGPALAVPDTGDVVFGATEWRTGGGAALKSLADRPALLLAQPEDVAARCFRLAQAGEFEVWGRLYFANKNVFEGRTMEEWAHAMHVLLDGCIQGTVLEQNRQRWTWYYFGKAQLAAGEHLLSVVQRGSPILLGELVLKRGDAPVQECSWYREPRLALLPFNFPGGVDPVSAARAGQWLILGPGAPGCTGRWLGEAVEGRAQVSEVNLPAASRLVVLAANWPLPCSPALSPQVVGWFCRGDLDGLKFRVVLLDRDRRAWLAPCQVVRADGAWSFVYYALAAARPAGADLEVLGDSGRIPEPLATNENEGRPRLALPAEQQLLPAADELELTHLVLEAPGDRARQLRFSEPAFSEPFTVRAEATAADRRARVKFQVTSTNPLPLTAELVVQVGVVGENVSAAEVERHWRRVVVPVAAAQPGAAEVSLPLPEGGACLVSYRLGLGPVRQLRLLAHPAAQPLLDRELALARTANSAYEDPAWRRPFPATEVEKHYGKDLRLTVDGLDVTTLEYAERHRSAKPFRVIGQDLSEAAGWPAIHVPPDTIAYDPTLGRLKFAEGYAGPCQVVSSYPTGFGVPGGGTPAIIGDYAVTPGGEGNFSVFDLRRDDRPTAVSVIPCWYFVHDAMPLRNLLFFNSSHRGFTVVDDLANPARPGVERRVELDVEFYGRVQRVDPDVGVALCDGGKVPGISVFSLADPLRPRLCSRLQEFRGPRPTGRPGQYLVSGPEGFALLDLRNPDQPTTSLIGPWPPGFEKAGIMAIAGDRLACRLPNAPVDVVVKDVKRQENRVVIACLRYTATGKNRGFQPLGAPVTDVTPGNCITAAWYQDYLYVVNGWNGPGQYSLGATSPHSEWYTFRLANGTLSLVGEKLVDEFPSAYAQLRIHGQRAYVTDYNIGMWTYDLTDPARPRKVARYYGAAEGDALWVDRGLAAFWMTFGGQTYLLDCRQPATTVCRGVYWDGNWVNYQNRFRGLNTIWGKDDVIYTPRGGKGLTIVDLTEPAVPKAVGVLNPAKGVYGNCMMRVRGDVLAVVQGENVTEQGKAVGKHHIRLYDVKHPRQPQPLGDVFARAGSAMDWRGRLLYLAEERWLSIVDTSDPRQPKIVSEVDLTTALPDAAGLAVTGMAVGDGVAYLLARGTHKDDAWMLLADVSNPAQPRPLRAMDSVTDLLPTECSESWANFYEDCQVRDEMLYVASYGRVECFDVREPLLPRLVASRDLGFQWSLGMLEGDFLYVPGLAEFILLKVPTSPQRPLGQLKVE